MNATKAACCFGSSEWIYTDVVDGPARGGALPPEESVPLQTKAAILSAPVFLVGSERSGTTLLRLMLDHHPRLAFEHEIDYVVDRVGEDGTFPDVATYEN